MKKITTTICFCLVLLSGFSQTQKKLPIFLLAQYNQTLYDETKGNNPWGIGIGLQTLFMVNKNSKIKPTLELTADVYLEDDKVLRISDDKPIDGVGSMVNLFGGAIYQTTRNTYLSATAGPSFLNGQVLLGVKPSFGFYFSDKHRWTGKISYINVFNRYKPTGQDFGSVSFSIGVRLF